MADETGGARAAAGTFLRCRVGGRDLLVPAQSVVRIIRFRRSAPPPGSAGWVAGLGVLDGRVFPVISPGAGSRTETAGGAGPPAETAGESAGLVMAAPGKRSGWVLGVDRVAGSETVPSAAWTTMTGSAPAAEGWACPAGWVRRMAGGAAPLQEVHSADWLDPRAVAATIYSEPAAAAP